MTRTETIDTLTLFSKWRRGAKIEPLRADKVNRAIDQAIHLLEVEPFEAFLRTHRALNRFRKECKPLRVGMDSMQFIQPKMNRAYWAYMHEKWVAKTKEEVEV